MYGGSEGCRTPYLLHAMQALSRLSYEPRIVSREGSHDRSQMANPNALPRAPGPIDVDRMRIELTTRPVRTAGAPLEHAYPKCWRRPRLYPVGALLSTVTRRPQMAPVRLLHPQGKSWDRPDSHWIRKGNRAIPPSVETRLDRVRLRPHSSRSHKRTPQVTILPRVSPRVNSPPRSP